VFCQELSKFGWTEEENIVLELAEKISTDAGEKTPDQSTLERNEKGVSHPR